MGRELDASFDPGYRMHLMTCAGTGCIACGSLNVKRAVEGELIKRSLQDEVRIVLTGCNGFCAKGPIIVAYPEGVFYSRVKPEDAALIVDEHVLNGRVVPKLLFKDEGTGDTIPLLRDIGFFARQKLIVLRNRGLIEVENMEECLDRNGYAALAKVLEEMTSEDVIEEVKKSGLRGRGGAGFGTGLKWEACRQSKGFPKYVICNGDEGDPGAFMDRSVMEGDPHSVLEGMAIAGYAVGAEQGYIYVRAEYPLAIERLQKAIDDARDYGRLGKDILGRGFNFDIRIYPGAGAFVCGEETALIRSIEGLRGTPRHRPPFPVHRGLFGRPTVINNVETYANINPIILNGSDWFGSIGTEGSKGTKVFALTGAINNVGLIEVPMGTTLKRLIFDIGGGIPKKMKFKAAQIGGPSGGCIPAGMEDVEIDYESLKGVGAMMGSGGVVVMDERTCMVDTARFFTNFLVEESCGKCTSCREGLKVMQDKLDDIVEGRGEEGDVEFLVTLGRHITTISSCGLGKTAANPVLSTIRYFRDEYDAHILKKRCPAGACEALVHSPCQHACPAGIDVPAYVAFIGQGDYFKAVDVIREVNPFPATCGRICHRPCEQRCRRGEVDEPISIRYLKRYAADWVYVNRRELPEPYPVTRTEKVAVVGAGPGGLTCAYFLAKMGYKTTVFEAGPRPGGMLAEGVPAFRLSTEVLRREVEHIEARGVEILCNSPIDHRHTLADLKAEGFDAIFVAAGAAKNLKLGIAGEEEAKDGLLYGLDLLRDVKAGRSFRVGERILIIGGGNIAIDAARTVLRKKARHVTIMYRRTREEMPAYPSELLEAEEEGVEFRFLVSPTRIESHNGKLTGARFARMTLGEPDESGRRRPVPIEGSEFFEEADTVIPAVGQGPDLNFLCSDVPLAHSKWDTLMVDPDTLCTNVPGIFAGGDLVTGPSLVIRAVAAGRRAAVSIDRYLRGIKEPLIIRDEKYCETPGAPHELVEADRVSTRIGMSRMRPEERLKVFDEFELGFGEEQARLECARCLRCDLERILDEERAAS